LFARNMKLRPEVANDLRSAQSGNAKKTSSPNDLSPRGLDPTDRNSESIGLHLSRYRGVDEQINISSKSHHIIVLFTKSPSEMQVRCEGVKRNSPPPIGSMALVPAGAVADVSWRGSKDCLEVYVEPDLIDRVAVRSFERDLSRAMPPLDAFIAPELRFAMLALETECQAGGPGDPLMVESLANVLVVHLIRHIFGFRQSGFHEPGVLPRRKLGAIIDYIMANLDNRPRLEQMAEMVHLSTDHFARQFKAATGLAPYQFVIARRVELAQQLLRGRQEVSLAEVAISAGFSDQSQLCFHFKRITGVTPGQFRMSGIA
jgi:AraC family transcriptional regulator